MTSEDIKHQLITIKQSNKATNFAESKEMLQKFIPLIAGLAALAVVVVLAVVLTHQLCAPSVIFLWRSATGHLPARGKTVRVCVLCKTVCMCVSYVRRGMSYVRRCVCVLCKTGYVLCKTMCMCVYCVRWCVCLSHVRWCVCILCKTVCMCISYVRWCACACLR